MTCGAADLARRLKIAAEYSGAKITLRRRTATAGPQPLLNPPIAVAVTVLSTTAQGLGTITLTGTDLRGRVLVGDKFTIAGDATVYTVTQQKDAASNQIVALAFSPVLAAQAAAGAAVSFTWSADKTLYAQVNSFPIRMVDGERIKMTDMQIILPASGVTPDPTPGEQIIFRGKTLEIRMVWPMLELGVPVAWTIQAR